MRRLTISHRRNLACAIVAILICATAFFVLIQVDAARSELRWMTMSDVSRLVPAVVLMTGAIVVAAATWAAIVSWLQTTPLGKGVLLRYFFVTWPARYVPGTLPYHAARVLTAHRLGSTRQAVAASIAYETILGLGSATTIGVMVLAVEVGLRGSTRTPSIPAWLPLVLLPLVALPFLLQPRLLVNAANKLLTIAHRPLMAVEDVLTAKQVLTATLGYCAVHTLNGLAFFLVLDVVSQGSVNPILAIGVFSLAAAAGVAVLFVPGGIGVREGAIVALLSGVVAPEDALLAAGLIRAVSILGDLLPVGFLGTFELTCAAKQRLTNRASPSCALLTAGKAGEKS